MMKRYKFLAIPLAALLTLGISMPMASAGFGTGIGIALPAGGTGSSSSKATDSYAQFSFGKISEELTVHESHGKLKMELKITNGEDNDYSVSHRDGQVYDFAVLDKNGKPLWRWSDGMAFTQALTNSSIAAHQSAVYTAEIDSKTYRSLKDDAVLVTAQLVDTPYVISTKVPTRVSVSSMPIVISGGVIFGNGHWYYDD